jgi:two-component system response regulator VanR
MKKTILIIEDEKAIQEILTEPLRTCGYEVITAEDGLEGINIFRTHPIDLILLDIMLPKINGYVVCEMVRKESLVPIILLTALDTEENQIKGFDLLADDYITKPFSIKLVLKRVEAILRRTESVLAGDAIYYREMSVFEVQRQVFILGKEIILTPIEFEILLLLAQNAGIVFSKEQIYDGVWKEPYFGDYNIVMSHIRNIRAKIEDNPSKPVYIQTVWGVGYRFNQTLQIRETL